jgi:hypothetical protein
MVRFYNAARGRHQTHRRRGCLAARRGGCQQALSDRLAGAKYRGLSQPHGAGLAQLPKDRNSNGVCPGSEVLEAKIKGAVRGHPCEESLGWDR